ncbi:MAG: hypothetical protein BWY14_01011 [Parcubacteria group bacterium ADurb.Bin192]|nr:MAG: hypothetical protein BWY14_01011 [Parcubacteria group bacterium ADurb.Bin192]
MTKVIAIDLDGVIHAYGNGWQDGSLYDPPMDGALEAMERLVKAGYKVVIHTARLNPALSRFKADTIAQRMRDIKAWLDEWGFRRKVHYHVITNEKPPAIAYIDDRGIRFTNWEDAVKYFV